MVQDAKRGRSLEETRAALERWRRAHGGRGRPIPLALWTEAAEVARTNGVGATARALRVDAGKLGRLARGAAPGSPPNAAEPSTFVALEGLGLRTAREGRTAVLELVGRDGDRVRLEVVGDAGAIDVAGLARAFWSRRA
jgi:hypothetical protein